MTLEETLLIIAFAAALIIPSFLQKKLRQPLNTYSKLLAGALLLVLAWFFAADGPVAVKVIITTLVVLTSIKTIRDFKSDRRRSKQGTP